jgi:hypothetical protein
MSQRKPSEGLPQSLLHLPCFYYGLQTDHSFAKQTFTLIWAPLSLCPQNTVHNNTDHVFHLWNASLLPHLINQTRGLLA